MGDSGMDHSGMDHSGANAGISNADKTGEKFALNAKGLAYSTTGATKGSGISILRTAMMAIDELNENGGIHGYHLIPKIGMKNVNDAKAVAIFGGNSLDFTGSEMQHVFDEGTKRTIFAASTSKYFDATNNKCAETNVYAGMSYDEIIHGLIGWAHSGGQHHFAIVTDGTFDVSRVAKHISMSARLK